MDICPLSIVHPVQGFFLDVVSINAASREVSIINAVPMLHVTFQKTLMNVASVYDSVC